MDRSQATRRFNREVTIMIARVNFCLYSLDALQLTPLIIQAEQLYHQTGCWIIFGAHAGSHDTSAVHYSSPNLHLHARDKTTEIMRQFVSITGHLKQAKYRNAQDIVRELEEYKAEAKHLREGAKAGKNHELLRELDEYKAEIKHLKQQAVDDKSVA